MNKREKMLSEARKEKRKAAIRILKPETIVMSLLNTDNQALDLSESGPIDLDNKSSKLQSPKKVEK